MKSAPAVAIVHYHLRRGGVTRVIETACRTLRALNVPVVVLSGEAVAPESSSLDAPVRVEPGLGYAARARCDDAAVRALADALRAHAVEALGRPPDVWHFHNAALGRNPAVARLPAHLGHAGAAVLAQCHDFAEDQRPEHWRTLVDALGDGERLAEDAPLYPVASHVRLAVLNARDRSHLVRAGAPPECVALLPNPVTAPESGPDTEPASVAPPLWLYPTRAIRRKNLGEFVLWAAVIGAEARFATTLEPTHPRDVSVYREWTQLAGRLRLPIRFGAGMQGETAFQGLMRDAATLVTTSVAEGFGLAFLEPWLAGKALTGRRLAGITVDMEEAGVDLSDLYDRLDLPLEWVGRDVLRTRIERVLRTVYRQYGLPFPHDAAEQAQQAVVRGDWVDFGGLDESLQRRVVRQVAASPDCASVLQPRRPAVRPAGDPVILHNRAIVASRYAPDAYGVRLRDLYLDLLRARSALAMVSPAALLTQFLRPERFRLLRYGGAG